MDTQQKATQIIGALDADHDFDLTEEEAIVLFSRILKCPPEDIPEDDEDVCEFVGDQPRLCLNTQRVVCIKFLHPRLLPLPRLSHAPQTSPLAADMDASERVGKLLTLMTTEEIDRYYAEVIEGADWAQDMHQEAAAAAEDAAAEVHEAAVEKPCPRTGLMLKDKVTTCSPSAQSQAARPDLHPQAPILVCVYITGNTDRARNGRRLRLSSHSRGGKAAGKPHPQNRPRRPVGRQ